MRAHVVVLRAITLTAQADAKDSLVGSTLAFGFPSPAGAPLGPQVLTLRKTTRCAR
ncbi:hypothetical protein [Streptomyces scopuliridis]|uniref:hypothetical protein n=1 Tax=Streptomyces scopuliridis TaxID=452529 RepID=UPI003679E1AC